MRDRANSRLREQRQAAVEEAQRTLARCLEAESRVEREAATCERCIAEETHEVTYSDTSDAEVEAFGLWLQAEGQHLAEARRLLESLQAATARERAVLSACRRALERCSLRAAANSAPA